MAGWTGTGLAPLTYGVGVQHSVPQRLCSSSLNITGHHSPYTSLCTNSVIFGYLSDFLFLKISLLFCFHLHLRKSFCSFLQHLQVFGSRTMFRSWIRLFCQNQSYISCVWSRYTFCFPHTCSPFQLKLCLSFGTSVSSC